MVAEHTQAGEEVSPPLTWSGAPDPTASCARRARPDAMRGNDETPHWLVWNILGKRRACQKVPHGAQLPDGTRQISATGLHYRDLPLPSGPPHRR